MSLKRTIPPEPETCQKRLKKDFFAHRVPKATGGSVSKFTFPEKPGSSTRIVTWNVNGIRSVDSKVLEKYLQAEDPSIVVLSETRHPDGKPDIYCLKSRFKYQYCAPGSHAGTAILSKLKPLGATLVLPTLNSKDKKFNGRYVELEFENIYLVGTYAPNSGESLQTLDLKREWSAALTTHLRVLDSKKPVVWAGDFNCIPTKKDLDKTAQLYWNNMGGLTTEERADLDGILNPEGDKSARFVDVWRNHHPTAEEYTHESIKYGAWRLDSFIMSERIFDKALHCEIRHELKGLKLSDHWPVVLDLETLLL